MPPFLISLIQPETKSDLPDIRTDNAAFFIALIQPETEFDLPDIRPVSQSGFLYRDGLSDTFTHIQPSIDNRWDKLHESRFLPRRVLLRHVSLAQS
jgi:hypothetical protein